MNKLLKIKNLREELRTTEDIERKTSLETELYGLIEDNLDLIISTLGTAAIAMHYRCCGTGLDYTKLGRAYDDLEHALTRLGVNLSNVNEA